MPALIGFGLVTRNIHPMNHNPTSLTSPALRGGRHVGAPWLAGVAIDPLDRVIAGFQSS